MAFRSFPWSVCGAAVIAVVLSTTACAPKHQVRVRENEIILSYRQDSADEVLFASSIDNFQLHPTTRVKDGNWEIEVPIIAPFTYFYLVDNAVTLPDCQATVLDDFGGRNCLFDIEL